ncbi:hypothetical protein [Haliangium sp.]|uniref:hypothetical protein n=1 Tax=Haliangium sp. TaxID=2663208 RepID=UPI003D09653F
MTLQVGITLDLGNARYDQHVIALRLGRGRLPAIDRLEALLPAGVELDAQPGDDVSLSLDGGEGESQVFTGQLTAVAHTPSAVRVTAHGGGLRLARYRPALSLETVTCGDVITQLCGDAGVDTGTVDGGPTMALYAADGRATALDETVRLAWLGGTQAAFDGDGRLFAAAGGGPGEDMALRYGRELIDAEVYQLVADETELAVAGEGAAAATAANARQVIVDFFAGAAPTPGPDTRVRAEPALRTSDDADAAAAAWTARRIEAEARVRFTAWLVPGLAPGARVEIQDAPGDLGLSECRVERVVHTIDARRGGRTRVWGSSVTDAGGGLLGALGGLL